MSEFRYTPKEEKFCIEVATGIDEDGRPISNSEAYRRAYSAGKMTDKTVNEKSSLMLAKDKIRARVQELRAQIAQKAQIGVHELLAELEEARKAALECETPQSAAAVSATMGKAKLLGLDKKIVELSNPDGTLSYKPSIIELVAPSVESKD